MFGIVVLLFFISGLSSLIYQVVWTRMLVFVFGSTVFASSTVLAVFMGGLALGAFIAGRMADRIKRPFIWYGILEGIIGLWSLASPLMFDAAIPIYREVWQHFHLSVIPFSLLRFAVAALILLPPTTCMGATLPLLSRFVTTSLAQVGDRVGTLYAINTLGAVVGAMSTGFVLLPLLGLQQTTLLAVASNFVLLAIVVVASRRYEQGHLLELLPKPETAEASAERLPPYVVAAMTAFAVSGAIALIYEVAWTRTLLMVIGSSTYAFTIMLGTFLIGIFIGSYVCARFVDRTKRPLEWFAIAQVILCGGGLLSVYLFNFVPYWNIVINDTLKNNANGGLLVRFILSGAVLLPITVTLGAIFPLVVKTCTSSFEAIGRSVGTLYSVNTLGAIVGAFLAGFVIIPMLGAERTLIYSSIMNLCIAAFLLWFSNLRAPIKYTATAAAATALCVVMIAQKPIWDPVLLMSAQITRRVQLKNPETFAVAPFDQWRDQLHRESKLLFWKDGACATVGVMDVLTAKNRSLLTNGHVDASDRTDMSNQVMLAGYPMVFHPEIKKVAAIGWGSGVSTGTAAAYPGVERVVSIEIEPAVLEAARYFDHVNLRPDANPKSFLEINDARNYLLATDEKFDAIIAEPSNPWQPGVCNLFTTEFFRIVRDRLAEKGVFCMWLQFQEVAPVDVLHVLSALQSQFPHVLPTISNGCMMVLASDSPISLDVDAANTAIKSNPALQDQLNRVGVYSAIDILASIMCSPDVVSRITQGVAPNTDDRNYLEFDVGKTYEHRLFQAQNEELLNKQPGKPWKLINWKNADAPTKATIMSKVAEKALADRNLHRAEVWAQESYTTSPNTSALVTQALVADADNQHDASKKFFALAEKLDPNSPELLMKRAQMNIRKGEMTLARADLAKLVSNKVVGNDARYLLAKTYTKVGSQIVVGVTHGEFNEQPQEVLKALGTLPDNNDFVKQHPDVLLIAGTANLHTNNQTVAERQLRQFVAIYPETVIGWRGLAQILSSKGNPHGAEECSRRADLIAQNRSTQEVHQATQLTQRGQLDDAVTVLEHALEYDPKNNAGRILLRSLADRGNARAVKLCGSLENP